MDIQKQFSRFFDAINEDPRISVIHIGLYVTLLKFWEENGYSVPFEAFSYQIMELAKISASTTYHKIIKDLNEYGYIKYIPSFKKNRGSKIYMTKD